MATIILIGLVILLLIRFEKKVDELQASVELHQEIGYDKGVYDTLKRLGELKE